MGQLALSVDCETLSLRENPALLSIGAVAFDPDADEPVSVLKSQARAFYVIIDLRDQVDVFDRHVDADTVMWWMKQPDEARSQIVSKRAARLDDAIQQFDYWIKNAAGLNACMWTHGAAEDAVWLRSAFRAVGIHFPVNYRNIRDTRTLFAVTGVPEIKVEGLVDHVALDDAIYQAKRIQYAHSILNSRKEAA